MASEGKPCECDARAKFSEGDNGVVTVRCDGCGSAWFLGPWLSETTRRVQRSEEERLGRLLTGWEAHNLADQCYFRTLPNGEPGVPGDTDAAIKAATATVDWAVELLLSGELSSWAPEKGRAEILRRLEERSTVVAEAVRLAFADIRDLSLDAKSPKVLRTVASLYVEDIFMGRIGPRAS